MKIQTLKIEDLNLVTNAAESNFRKDLHFFVQYIQTHIVKRAARGNEINKTDMSKITKNISFLPPVRREQSDWVNFIDWLALKMEFINYDSKGEYIGYSSREPTFRDNYIKINKVNYTNFLNKSIQEQEIIFLNKLLNISDDSDNEFFERAILGRLDSFNSRGCATGVIPTLNFASARQYLLDQLVSLDSDEWYSTAAFIEFVKTNNPYFLIPKKPIFKNQYDSKYGRYGDNFKECKGENYYSGDVIKITEGDIEAFERVEGRYIERFLEKIPLLLGYVDVAYDDKKNLMMHPSKGELIGFRVQKKLAQIFQKNMPEPIVRIQPNFEIYVESELYPAKILNSLKSFCTIKKEGNMTVLQLSKEMVTQELAKNSTFDLKQFLSEMLANPIPQNIVVEIQSWGRHAEAFTLYENCGLLEYDATLNPEVEFFVLESISDKLKIIQDINNCTEKLIQAELIPISIQHDNQKFLHAPDEAKSIFPKKIIEKKLNRPCFELKRQTMITHYFPNEELFKVFFQKLEKTKNSVIFDKANKSITVPASFSSHFNKIAEDIAGSFKIDFKDV